MARSKYRKEIELLIESLNNLTGMNYMTDYAPHYDGWNLCRLNEHSGHCTGLYGFDYRRSNKEMVAYLRGLLIGLQNPLKSL
jgi:hypothetical protein